MKFSIIVPIYNVSAFLEECIESILQQSFRDYELILVDDGSTDSSPGICDRYAEKDSRIRVIHKKNGGLVSARKAAAQVIKGDYVLSIDGDDKIGADYLLEVSGLIDTSQADMIAWGYTRTDCKGEKLNSYLNYVPCGLYTEEKLDKIRRGFLYDPDQDEINMGVLLYNLADKAIKREIYVKNQMLVPDGIVEAEDASANWLILKEIQSLQISDLDRYYYRLNQGSITAGVSEKSISQQKILEDFLLNNADNEEQLERIRGFAFYRIHFIIDRAVRSGYSAYRKIVKAGEKEGIYDQCVMASIKNISKGNALRKFFIKKRWWFLLYTYHKMRSIK